MPLSNDSFARAPRQAARAPGLSEVGSLFNDSSVSPANKERERAKSSDSSLFGLVPMELLRPLLLLFLSAAATAAQQCCTGRYYGDCKETNGGTKAGICGNDVPTGTTSYSSWVGHWNFCGWAWEERPECANDCGCTTCPAGKHETKSPSTFADRKCAACPPAKSHNGETSTRSRPISAMSSTSSYPLQTESDSQPHVHFTDRVFHRPEWNVFYWGQRCAVHSLAHVPLKPAVRLPRELQQGPHVRIRLQQRLEAKSRTENLRRHRRVCRGDTRLPSVFVVRQHPWVVRVRVRPRLRV